MWSSSLSSLGKKRAPLLFDLCRVATFFLESFEAKVKIWPKTLGIHEANSLFLTVHLSFLLVPPLRDTESNWVFSTCCCQRPSHFQKSWIKSSATWHGSRNLKSCNSFETKLSKVYHMMVQNIVKLLFSHKIAAKISPMLSGSCNDPLSCPPT